MNNQTNSYEITSSKVVNLQTENGQAKLKVEYGTNRSFGPQYYQGGEALYIVMNEYVEVNGQKIPLTMDYYSPNGNFRLHSSFSGTQIDPRQLVKGKNFEVRDVGHVELVSQHDDLISITAQLMTLIDLIRSGNHVGLRRYI